MAEILTRYDVEDDALVEVTQEWVDGVSTKIVELENALRIAQAEKNDGRDRARVETAEGQQGLQDSRESREGVQQSGRGQGQAGREAQVAVAYAVTVDGWIEIKHKAIRNCGSQLIVWMTQGTWQALATHADVRGLFYIPADTAQTPDILRQIVTDREASNGS